MSGLWLSDAGANRKAFLKIRIEPAVKVESTKPKKAAEKKSWRSRALPSLRLRVGEVGFSQVHKQTGFERSEPRFVVSSKHFFGRHFIAKTTLLDGPVGLEVQTRYCTPKL